MRKNLLLLALVGCMLTGCGSKSDADMPISDVTGRIINIENISNIDFRERVEEIMNRGDYSSCEILFADEVLSYNDKTAIYKCLVKFDDGASYANVNMDGSISGILAEDVERELAELKARAELLVQMREEAAKPAKTPQQIDEENKQKNLELVEEFAPSYVTAIINDFASWSASNVRSGRGGSGSIKLDIQYDDILSEAEARGIVFDTEVYGKSWQRKKDVVDSIIEELMLKKAEELRAECEAKFIEVAKEEIENGKYGDPGVIKWGEDAEEAVREILNRIDEYYAIATEAEREEASAAQEALAEEYAAASMQRYTLTINGIVYEGTVDEIVAQLPNNEGIYSFTITEGIANSHFLVDSASAAKESILRYVMSAAKKEVENIVEVDYDASIHKLIVDYYMASNIDWYFNNGYVVDYFTKSKDGSDEVYAIVLTSDAGSVIWGAVLGTIEVGTIESIDALNENYGNVLGDQFTWEKYTFGETDWAAYIQEIKDVRLAYEESFSSDPKVRQAAVDEMIEEKGYSGTPIGYCYSYTSIVSILLKTETEELWLYEMGTFRALSNWSERFNFRNEDEFRNEVTNNSVTDTLLRGEDYIWDIYE